MKTHDREGITLDFFYRNKVRVFQNRNGYRFSVDSPVLADFIPHSEFPGIEIGSGSGIISLLLLHMKKLPGVTGIEIQERLCELSEMSIEANGFGRVFKVVNGDFNRVYPKFKGVMNIFANPPYLRTGLGHQSRNEEVRRGKFEIDITLEDILLKSGSILGEGGNLFLILPFNRYEELLRISGPAGLFPVRLRKIHSFRNGKPERFLIQLTNSNGDLEEVSPLIIYHSVGVYSDEMNEIFAGR